MGKYRGPTCRMSRRFGTDLQLKSGVRALDSKCRMERPPGMHWMNRGRKSDYALQLIMKQMIRGYYGIMEKQFRRHYLEADRRKGATGVNLMLILESRLDNVVYRLGFASTRAEARQLVSHHAILVNGKRVSIPSFLVSPGDVVEVATKAKGQLRIQAALELAKSRAEFSWLEVDDKNKRGVFKAHPEFDDLPPEFKVNLVVELYSK